MNTKRTNNGRFHRVRAHPVVPAPARSPGRPPAAATSRPLRAPRWRRAAGSGWLVQGGCNRLGQVSSGACVLQPAGTGWCSVRGDAVNFRETDTLSIR
jgi:hypothetical protein